MIFLMLCHITSSLAPKPGPGQREQQQKKVTSSASTSEHSVEKIIRQTQRNREDAHCDEDRVGRGEVDMETDGDYYAEEVNSFTK
jgi:hypothetical protein